MTDSQNTTDLANCESIDCTEALLDGNSEFKARKRQALRPLGDRVVVEPTQVSDEYDSGLIKAEVAKERPNTGKVVAISVELLTKYPPSTPLADTLSGNLSVGDMVLYGKYSGVELELDGQKILVLKVSDILGVVE